jgi:hypothetical protein
MDVPRHAELFSRGSGRGLPYYQTRSAQNECASSLRVSRLRDEVSGGTGVPQTHLSDSPVHARQRRGERARCSEASVGRGDRPAHDAPPCSQDFARD